MPFTNVVPILVGSEIYPFIPPNITAMSKSIDEFNLLYIPNPYV
jgi:hypothetical protein